MLAEAEIDPQRINDAMDRRIRMRQGGMLAQDHFPRLLAKVTGMRVNVLRRRNRYLLLEADVRGTIYREVGRTKCDFLCPGTLSPATQIAARGKALNEVISHGVLGPFMGGVTIESPSDAWDGAVAFNLQPRWQRFGE
ncbi:MAG: hypothetical protein EON55_13645 [Alphaproteobacteria bacterium]|nr:MAG: hypothetical protein EON55_13645 [Alphaproteobacteria bacterium]